MEKPTTLEEKYAYAVKALREMVARQNQPRGQYCFSTKEASYFDGYDSGVQSMADDAVDVLRFLDEPF